MVHLWLPRISQMRRRWRLRETGLEHELQRELDLAPGGGCAGDDACRGANGVPREDHRVRFQKVRVIENVESLRPKLQTPPLIDLELLEQRSVNVDQTR